MSIVSCILPICLLTMAGTSDQNFRTTRITEHVFIVSDTASGDAQLVITSEKGLVIFDSFWSEITARKFKDEIAQAFTGHDFAYVIDTVDRLDMFGGNAAYREAEIVGHRAFLEKYKGKEQEVDAEIGRLIDMWRNKARVSRERLATHEPGSESETMERMWMNTCTQRADELETGFSLVLPTIVYQDQMTLDLGDVTLVLIWFGRAGYDGLTVAVVPEERLAVISGFIMHSQHLAPHPFGAYTPLDVPRWIDVLEELLEGENAVERVVCDINSVWSRDRAHKHLTYIRELWNRIEKAEETGMDIPEIQEQLSLDGRFAFVKDMQQYKDHGDEWIRPQHQSHVTSFFLQMKNPASRILQEGWDTSSQDAVAKIKKLRDDNADIYFHEASINAFGYRLLQAQRIPEAIAVFQLNVEVFPESANAYDSLAEGYMRNGDSKSAIRYYKKSLDLNPGNDNAKAMLQSLES